MVNDEAKLPDAGNLPPIRFGTSELKYTKYPLSYELLSIEEF